MLRPEAAHRPNYMLNLPIIVLSLTVQTCKTKGSKILKLNVANKKTGSLTLPICSKYLIQILRYFPFDLVTEPVILIQYTHPFPKPFISLLILPRHFLTPLLKFNYLSLNFNYYSQINNYNDNERSFYIF